MDPAIKALTAAIDSSTKVGSTPLFSTVIDKLIGFKISEWKAQGDAIQKQIIDGYEDAKKRGLGFQYVSNFRATANLINIGNKAVEYVDSRERKDIPIDDDFFWGLIEHAKGISSEEMQELIAKIMAGEYNQPGTYTMSTLQTLKMLGKMEIELFERMASLLVNGSQIPQQVFSLPENLKEVLGKLRIDFGSLQILQSLGLFYPNDMTSTMQNISKQLIIFKYFDKPLIFEPENDNYQAVSLPGFYGLSPVGNQLIKHLKPIYIEKYFLWLKENYLISNYKLKS